MTTAPAVQPRQKTLTGTLALLRFMLRRDRLRTNAWVLGIGAAAFYFAHAIQRIAETEEELRSLAFVFADPIGRMMTGPAFGMEDPSHERFFASGYVLYVYILIALMSAFTVVRHTRLEEQTGRAELVRAHIIGRHATLTAALMMNGVANAGTTALVWLAAMTAGYSPQGSALVALGGLAVGLLFAAAASVTSQIWETSRGASGAAGSLIGLAFLIRMGGDAAETGGNAFSWFSPLAWSQQTGPYVLDRWWPLVFPLVFAVVLTAVSFWLSTRRDLGANLLPIRLGRATAKPGLGSPRGLALRTLRGSLRGWTLGLVLTGIVFGSFAQIMADAADDLPPDLIRVFAGDDLIQGYLAYVALFMAVFVGAAGVSALHQVRTEEAEGRAELGLSAPMSRTAWMGAHLTIVLLGVGAILIAAAVAMGAGTVAVLQNDRASYFIDLLAASAHQSPAVLAVIGIVVGLLGWLPRAASLVGWIVVGYSAIMVNFGQLLELPEFVRNLNIFGHLSQYPAEDIAWTPAAVLTLIGIVGIFVGLLGWNRREIVRA